MALLVQKDILFEMSFTLPMFKTKDTINLLKNVYHAKVIKKKWSWRKPLSIKVVAKLNIAHEIDIDKMRDKQHELFLKRFTTEEEDNS